MLALLVSFAAVCALVAGGGAAVAATPATVSPTPVPTAQLNGVAFAQVVIGRTVYVGGQFSKARPAGAAPGTSTVPRSDLLAYDLVTGRLTGWAPRANGVVRGLARSADGRTIYAVGSFTKVDGHDRSRVVAIATSGAVRAGFHPQLNSSASAVAVSGSTVYVGGRFTSAAGSPRSRAAAFDRTTGRLRPWRPALNGEVLAIALSSTGRSAVLGGRFDRVNGSFQPGSQRVGTGDGRTDLSWALNGKVGNSGPDAAIYSLTSSGGYVYGTGYSYASSSKHRLEGSFVATFAGGQVHWLEDCHGDSYSIAPDGGVVYLAGHAHFCGNIGGFPEGDPPVYHRGIAFTQAVTGTVRHNTVKGYSDFAGEPAPTLLDWFPAFNIGSATGQNQGPWSVTVSGDWVLYAGEFTKVGGTAQQGLVRFHR